MLENEACAYQTQALTDSEGITAWKLPLNALLATSRIVPKVGQPDVIAPSDMTSWPFVRREFAITGPIELQLAGGGDFNPPGARHWASRVKIPT